MRYSGWGLWWVMGSGWADGGSRESPPLIWWIGNEFYGHLPFRYSLFISDFQRHALINASRSYLHGPFAIIYWSGDASYCSSISGPRSVVSLLCFLLFFCVPRCGPHITTFHYRCRFCTHRHVNRIFSFPTYHCGPPKIHPEPPPNSPASV